MPDDAAFDYLATQAIADFLAMENDPLLDGIIFRSAQVKNGRNVVLFHKAAQVEAMKFPDGTEINARTKYGTAEGWEIDYSVIESVPLTPPEKVDDRFLHGSPYLGPFYFDDNDLRGSALRIDPKSVVVHHVEWVTYNSTPFKVDRCSRIKHDRKF